MSLARPVFTAKSLNRSWSVGDVIDWSHFAGELDAPWGEFICAESDHRRALESGQEPDSAAVQELSEVFRYDRDLITAEETERWLGSREVTMDAFVAHLERHCWPGQSAGPLSPIPAFDTATAEQKEAFRVDLLLTGELERLARALSRRVVASAVAQKSETTGAVEALSEERARFLQRRGLEESRVAAWLSRLGRDPDWLQEQLLQESGYRAACAAALSPAARESVLRSQRLQLLDIRLEVMRFPSLDAAREAALCVREENQSLAEFSAACGHPLESRSFLLGSVSDDDQSTLLSRSLGEVVGPDEVEGEFQICRLAAKEEPRLSNPAVADAVDRQLLDAWFTALGADMIQWAMAERISA